jgi:hypothetical protein
MPVNASWSSKFVEKAMLAFSTRFAAAHVRGSRHYSITCVIE